MKPAPFEYFAAETLEQALELLGEHGFDAKLLAGGQSLVPTMNFRLAQPAVLVDLNRIADLVYVEADDRGELRLGAMTRQAELERNQLISKHAPLVAETMPHVAHPQIRNRGTLGGSLAHADPAAELPAVMVALDARFRLQSRQAERWVAAADFFIDLFMVDLQPDEALVEIAIPPLPANTGCAFQEVARRHGDYALAGVAARITKDENGVCRDARIVLLSVGNTPVRAKEAEQVLMGQPLLPDRLQAAADHAAQKEIEPTSDMHASEAYRRHLAGILTRRALAAAADRA